MAFIQASASVRERAEIVLSADNSRPERHIVIDTLRQAASLMGLKSPVIATLDAMLSCLPPKRQHNTVFASNATLAFRRNGITDRTIRRHVAILQELGLLVRRDSANRKRFSRKNATGGLALRFGFDLTPLFQRFQEIAGLAAQANQEKDQVAYLKAKVRAAANEVLHVEPCNALAIDTIRMLRRKLTIEDLDGMLEALGSVSVEAEQPCAEIIPGEEKMSASNGQNVRHLHNSNKENIDKNVERSRELRQNEERATPLTVEDIVEACPEAAQFAINPVTKMADIVSHARTLAPMLGIDAQNYEAAQNSIGIERTAITIWAMMQFHSRIKKVGAYFRSITSGQNSVNFSPEKLVRRLALMSQAPA